MNHTLIRLCAALLLIGLGLFWHKPAEAQDISCTATMTAVAFGTVDPQSSLTDATGTLHYTCTNSNNKTRYAKICFSIGDGVQGNLQTNPRQMQDGSGDILQFQLYQDSAHSLVWGSQFFGAFPTPYQATIAIAGNGSISSAPDPTIYGRVLNGQTAAVPGSYQNAFAAGHTAITINEGKNSAPTTCDSAIVSSFPFTATATVQNKCTVSATTLNFNSVGLLTSAIPATSSISVQCAAGTPYSIGLNGGLNSGNNINARTMVLGANSVAYQLYRDSARTQVWGDTVNTNTVQGTGTGNSQSLTVYGQVPAQPTPPAGTYKDTVIVSVSY